MVSSLHDLGVLIARFFTLKDDVRRAEAGKFHAIAVDHDLLTALFLSSGGITPDDVYFIESKFFQFINESRTLLGCSDCKCHASIVRGFTNALWCNSSMLQRDSLLADVLASLLERSLVRGDVSICCFTIFQLQEHCKNSTSRLQSFLSVCAERICSPAFSILIEFLFSVLSPQFYVGHPQIELNMPSRCIDLNVIGSNINSTPLVVFIHSQLAKNIIDGILFLLEKDAALQKVFFSTIVQKIGMPKGIRVPLTLYLLQFFKEKNMHEILQTTVRDILRNFSAALSNKDSESILPLTSCACMGIFISKNPPIASFLRGVKNLMSSSDRAARLSGLLAAQSVALVLQRKGQAEAKAESIRFEELSNVQVEKLIEAELSGILTVRMTAGISSLVSFVAEREGYLTHENNVFFPVTFRGPNPSSPTLHFIPFLSARENIEEMNATRQVLGQEQPLLTWPMLVGSDERTKDNTEITKKSKLVTLLIVPPPSCEQVIKEEEAVSNSVRQKDDTITLIEKPVDRFVDDDDLYFSSFLPLPPLPVVSVSFSSLVADLPPIGIREVLAGLGGPIPVSRLRDRSHKAHESRDEPTYEGARRIRTCLAAIPSVLRQMSTSNYIRSQKKNLENDNEPFFIQKELKSSVASPSAHDSEVLELLHALLNLSDDFAQGEVFSKGRALAVESCILFNPLLAATQFAEIIADPNKSLGCKFVLLDAIQAASSILSSDLSEKTEKDVTVEKKEVIGKVLRRFTASESRFKSSSNYFASLAAPFFLSLKESLVQRDRKWTIEHGRPRHTVFNSSAFDTISDRSSLGTGSGNTIDIAFLTSILSCMITILKNGGLGRLRGSEISKATIEVLRGLQEEPCIQHDPSIRRLLAIVVLLGISGDGSSSLTPGEVGELQGWAGKSAKYDGDEQVRELGKIISGVVGEVIG